MITITLGELVKQRGKSLYWLSQESGIRYATIWRLSKDNVPMIPVAALDKICEVLECQPGDLLQYKKRRR
jgi:putative transcriptional regulator